MSSIFKKAVSSAAFPNKRLFVYSSPREGSISTKILKNFAANTKIFPTSQVSEFKLYEFPLLPRLEEAISLRYSKPNYNSSQQELIAKLKEHIEWLNGFDEIFWAVPMHNFGPGTHFKNYIDLLFNPDLAFSYENGKLVLNLKDIPYHFVVTGGGAYVGGQGDFVIPWMKQMFGWVQKKHQTYYPVQGTLSPKFDLPKAHEAFEKEMEKLHKAEFKQAEKEREDDLKGISTNHTAQRKSEEVQ